MVLLESSMPSPAVPASARVALPKELLRYPEPSDRAFRVLVTLITMAKKNARTIEITQDKLMAAMNCGESTVRRATREAEKFYGLELYRWTSEDKKQHIRYTLPRFKGGLVYVQKQVVYGLKADCDLRTYLVAKSAEHKVKTKYVRRTTAWFAKMLGLSGKTAERNALKRLRRLGRLLIPRHTGGALAVKGVVQLSMYDEKTDLSDLLRDLENGTSSDRYTPEGPGPQMTGISTLSYDKKEKDRQLQEEDLKDLEDQKPKLKLIVDPAAAWPDVVIPGSGGKRAPNLNAPKALWREVDDGVSGERAVSGA